MRFHKFISVIIHPIVLPTIGVMLYFLVVPNNFILKQKFTILSLIFIVTYLIPLLVLFIFKKLKIIENFQPENIKEKKLPLAMMISLFYIVGNTLDTIIKFKDLSILFYATSIGLFTIYLLFYRKIKASVHLFSLGIFTGFFMVLSSEYSQSYAILIIILLLISGVIASARLHLKAHNPKEVYIGFFIGLISIFSLYYFL